MDLEHSGHARHAAGPRPRRHGRLFLGFFLTVLFAGVLLAASIARGPDRQLVLRREATTDVPRETLGRALQATINWPRWFHAVTEAKIIDITGQPYSMALQRIESGSLVRLRVALEGAGKPSASLQAQVLEYAPERGWLKLGVAAESAQRLSELFDRVDWEIEISPGKVSCAVIAHTRHWKARLLGAVAPGLLLDEYLLPEAGRLAAIADPWSPNPLPPGRQ